jgi:hypothetical protein
VTKLLQVQQEGTGEFSKQIAGSNHLPFWNHCFSVRNFSTEAYESNEGTKNLISLKEAHGITGVLNILF